MISDIVMESNTNNPGQFVFRVDDGVSNKTCSLNTGNALWYLANGRKNVKMTTYVEIISEKPVSEKPVEIVYGAATYINTVSLLNAISSC